MMMDNTSNSSIGIHLTQFHLLNFHLKNIYNLYNIAVIVWSAIKLIKCFRKIKKCLIEE